MNRIVLSFLVALRFGPAIGGTHETPLLWSQSIITPAKHLKTNTTAPLPSGVLKGEDALILETEPPVNDVTLSNDAEEQDDDLLFLEEWIEDGDFCWPIDNAWYTEQDFYLLTASCEDEGFDWGWDDDYQYDFYDEFAVFTNDEFFEWMEDEQACYLIDQSWYLNEAFYLQSAICYIEEDWVDEANNMESTMDMNMNLDDAAFNDWVHFVHPDDDLQLDMPFDLAREYLTYDEQPNFFLPRYLSPGEVEDIRWRDTGDIIDDDEIFAVGLPAELLHEFQRYFENDTGILKVVQELLYSTKPRNKTMDETQLWTLDDGHKWSVKRADHWQTDMVWFDPADEACYERLRSVLRKGNFETVVQAIGDRLRQNLVVHGMGAIFVGRFEGSLDYWHLHRDVPESRGAFYNILVPIYLPVDGDASSLYIGGINDHICSPMNLRHDVALVIGSDSWHGTGECDHRHNQSFRLSMSIWVSEITEPNLEVIADDGLSPWPVSNDKAWYRAQANRSLAQDGGRASLDIQDQRQDCETVKDQCETDLWGIRAECLKTCQVYMETTEYHANLEALKQQEAGGG